MERVMGTRSQLGWLVVGVAAALGGAQAAEPDAAERAAAVDQANAAQPQGAAPLRMTPELRAKARRYRGSGTPPGLAVGPDNRQSQRAVCQAQCNLERQACDQGRDSFRDRRDQITSYTSSCYLAVSSCLSRC